MAVNQVNLANGEELINLTEDTVSEDTLLENATAHDASGKQITGKFVPYNPNLLDNWYFAQPINQRGQTAYTQEQQYCVDRWVQRGGGTVTLTEEGLHSSATYAFAGVMQGLENGKKNLAGKIVTFSVLLHNVSGGAVTIGITNGAGAGFVGVFIAEKQTATEGLIFVTATIPKNLANESLNVAVVTKEGSESEFTIKAVKLELGSIQTLAHKDAEGNWVLNDPPPNPATELAKYQRYFYRVGLESGNVHHGVGISSNTFRCLVTMPTPVTMRTNPTVTITGKVYLSNGAAPNVLVKEIAAAFKTGVNASAIQLYVDTESGALVAGGVYLLRTESSFIDFSADL